MNIELPFPSSKLAGQNTGHWSTKDGTIAAHRLLAKAITKKAGVFVLGEGDIALRIDFYRPNRKGDRVNFPIRMKPYIDGIADALKINDSRFVPEYHFHDEFDGKGRVVVSI